MRQRKAQRNDNSSDRPEGSELNDQDNLKSARSKALAGASGASPSSAAEEPQLSLADEIRARSRASRLGQPYPSKLDNLGGPGFAGPFNRLDLIVFLILFALLWAVVKAEYKVDLLHVLWDKVKPDYDEGHFDS